MKKIDDYKEVAHGLYCAKNWLGMIGRDYHGGGGGIGRVISANTTAKIYYQANDGDKNYHDAPEMFVKYLSEQVIRHFKILSQAAIEKMEEDAKNAAQEAATEYGKLMEAAGLSVNP